MGSLKKEEEMGQIGEESKEAIVYVNGVRKVLPDGLAHLTLLEYLRDIGLTGTKLGCGEGGCGACTVMISHYDRKTKKCMHYAVNACLAPLYSVEGMHVITVEGLGNHKRGLHPIQESLARSHGSQCGFCTPGFIMSLYALLRSSETPPTEEQIEESLAGNLCRCTGYRPIVVLMSILLSIFLPWTRPFEYVKEFNQAHRRDDDIAIVNAGMCVCLQEKSEEWVISDASVAYGGVAPLSLCAIKTE